MDKKYNVFVSSTYTDLKDERWAAIQALLRMGHIVSGMEWFPAVDMEQFEYIKTQIDLCDYYVLIIAGRYGTIAPTGYSYTEMEYDYAVEKGLPVVALIHEHPEKLPMEYCDIDPVAREKFNAFREKARTGRLVQPWNKKEDISANIPMAMFEAIRIRPAVGWVRADRVASAEILQEINELRKENAKIQKKLINSETKRNSDFAEIAALDEKFSISGYYYSDDSSPQRQEFEILLTWLNIFYAIADLIKEGKNTDYQLRGRFEDFIFHELEKEKNITTTRGNISDDYYYTVIVQFKSHDLIKEVLARQHSYEIYKLTDKGEKKLLTKYFVRTKK